jgi:hypothetical protein
MAQVVECLLCKCENLSSNKQTKKAGRQWFTPVILDYRLIPVILAEITPVPCRDQEDLVRSLPQANRPYLENTQYETGLKW